MFFFSFLRLLCLCARLFICALRSPVGKGLTSWLSFVVYADLCTLTYFAYNVKIRTLWLMVAELKREF